MLNSNVYYRDASGWITCTQCGASASPENPGRPPCACGSKGASMFRKGVLPESEVLTESDLIGIREATTSAALEALQGGGDDSSQSSAKLALRKGPQGSILWQKEKNRIDGIRMRSRAAEDHMEATLIAVKYGVAGAVRRALGGAR